MSATSGGNFRHDPAEHSWRREGFRELKRQRGSQVAVLAEGEWVGDVHSSARCASLLASAVTLGGWQWRPAHKPGKPY